MSKRPVRSRIVSTQARTDSSMRTSNGPIETPGTDPFANGCREVPNTSKSLLARSPAMASPKPDDAPVTRTTFLCDITCVLLEGFATTCMISPFHRTEDHGLALRLMGTLKTE